MWTRPTNECGSATARNAGAAGGTAPVALGGAPPAGEVHRHGGLSTTADGEWVLAVREIHREDRLGRCAAWSPCRPVPRRRARPRCSPATISSAPPDRIPPATGWPWWPGTIPTCRGTPRSSWSCPCAGCACTRHEHDVLQAVGPAQRVAGGPAESVGQPAWNRGGTLRFVSDRHGWWQPYLQTAFRGGPERTPMTTPRAEFHGPDWVLGQQTMVEMRRRDLRGPDDGVGTGRARVVGSPGRRGAPAGALRSRASPSPRCARTGTGWP